MKKFLLGFVYAGRGIVAGVRGQRNIKVMIGFAVCAVALGLYLGLKPAEWVQITTIIGLVLALELLNTAGEKLIDILCPGADSRYGQIKDILAGAVLIASIAALVVGLVIYLPKLMELRAGLGLF